MRLINIVWILHFWTENNLGILLKFKHVNYLVFLWHLNAKLDCTDFIFTYFLSAKLPLVTFDLYNLNTCSLENNVFTFPGLCSMYVNILLNVIWMKKCSKFRLNRTTVSKATDLTFDLCMTLTWPLEGDNQSRKSRKPILVNNNLVVGH